MILRSCTMADLSLLEEWDPTGEMWVGDKREWLEKRVNDNAYYMFIGDINALSTPYTRVPATWGAIKVEPEYFVLSWFTAPKYRNRGYAIKMAELLARMVSPPCKAKSNANRPSQNASQFDSACGLRAVSLRPEKNGGSHSGNEKLHPSTLYHHR